MEIIGSNSLLKDTETQATSNNYNCHLPRDMNFGMTSTPKSKGEADIGLLVACKVQLSSEVIRWKTESFRLQKERDSAQLRTKDLNHTVSKLVDKTKELEERLAQAEEENKLLKRRSVALDDDRVAVMQKLSLGINKYHSFPCSESPIKSSHHFREARKSREISAPPEDLREVSQRLIDRMNEEVREMQEISCKYQMENISGKNCNLSDTLSHKTDSHCKEEIENDISILATQTASLKQHLFEQRRQLKSLMNYISTEECQEDCSNGSLNVSSSSIPQLPTQISSKYSSPDRSARNLPTSSKASKEMGCALRIMQDEIGRQAEEMRQNCNISVSVRHPEDITEESKIPEDKICPICEECFNTVPQLEFEEHVLNHLEKESASLLDQYVIV